MSNRPDQLFTANQAAALTGRSPQEIARAFGLVSDSALVAASKVLAWHNRVEVVDQEVLDAVADGRLLTITQAAEAVHLSRERIYQLLRAGTIEHKSYRSPSGRIVKLVDPEAIKARATNVQQARNQQAPGESYVSLAEGAARMGIQPPNLYQRIRRGFPAEFHNGRWWVLRDNVPDVRKDFSSTP